MAKRASLSLSGIAAQKPKADPETVTEQSVEVSEVRKVGRPRSLPKDYRSMTIRLSAKTHTALNVLAATHNIPAKKIILDGLADQFARYGVVEDVE